MTGGMWPERLDAALRGSEPGQPGIASGDVRRGAARPSAPLGRAGGLCEDGGRRTGLSLVREKRGAGATSRREGG